MDIAQPYSPDKHGFAASQEVERYRRSLSAVSTRLLRNQLSFTDLPDAAEILEKNSALILFVRDELKSILLFHGRDGGSDIVIPVNFKLDRKGLTGQEFDQGFTRYLVQWLVEEHFETFFMGGYVDDFTPLASSVHRVDPALSPNVAEFEDTSTGIVTYGFASDLKEHGKLANPVLSEGSTLVVKKEGSWRNYRPTLPH